MRSCCLKEEKSIVEIEILNDWKTIRELWILSLLLIDDI